MAVHSSEDQKKSTIESGLLKDRVLSNQADSLYRFLKTDLQNQLPEGTVLLGDGFLSAKVILFTDEED